MLKGHTTIELTNVHSGKKEIVESDNMFTNALDTLINKRGVNHLGNYSPYFKLIPLVEKGLRGILLFPVKLEESVDNIYPKTAFIAHAGSSTDVGTDVTKGAYNATESVPLTNGYRFVWDFTTSQGNGTIACLSLTSDLFGNTVMDSDAATFAYGIEFLYMDTGDSRILIPPSIGYDSNNQDYWNYGCVVEDTKDYVIYAAPGSKKSVNYIAAISILKLAQTMSMVCLKTSLYPTLEIVKEIPLPEANISYNALTFYYNSKVYCAMAKDTSTLYLYKIDVDAETVTKDVITIANLQTNLGITNAFYKNGYLYFMRLADKTYTLSKMNLANYADITDIVSSTTTDGTLQYIERVKAARISKVGILFEDDTLYQNNTVCGRTVISDSMYHFNDIFIKGLSALGLADYGYSGSSNYYLNVFHTLCLSYLATINNLTAPVVKTADQTMKITYTVTES